MRRASVEPVVGIGTDLVESARARVEDALDTTSGRLRDLVEGGATRATAGLDRIEQVSPVITVGRRKSRSRRLLVVLFILAAGATVAWLWSRRASGSGSSRTDTVSAEPEHQTRASARYEVVQAAAGGWEVVGSTDTEQQFRTQAEALESAKRIASSAGGGEIVIHGLDGKPRTTVSIPRTA